MTNELSTKRQRSPNYPSFSLDEAIERTQRLYDRERRNWTGLSVAAVAWGLSESSSSLLSTISSLRQYGLIDAEASGSGRKVRVSALGYQILHDARADERREALQTAALSPKLFRELWDRYGSELPSPENLESALAVDHGFNPSAVRRIVSAYRKTLDFISIAGRDTILDSNAPEAGEPDATAKTFASDDRSTPSNAPAVSGQPAGQGRQIGASWTFPLPCGAVEISFRGGKPSRADIDMLKMFLDVALRSLSSETEQNGEGTDTENT